MIYDINSIKKGELLPGVDLGSSTLEYAHLDDEKLFLKNLKITTDNWYYRTHKVNYKINSKGYREKEFDTLDWANSVVIFGCSEVWGVGVDDSSTIVSFLSKLIKFPVINLGVAGSSIMFALHNALILNQSYPTPKAVINLWTEYYRTVSYKETGLVVHHGVWNPDSYLANWAIDDVNPATHAVFCQMASHQLWKGKTIYYEASLFEETAKLFNCEHLIKIDHARDLVHSGVESNRAIAGKIAKYIINNIKEKNEKIMD